MHGYSKPRNALKRHVSQENKMSQLCWNRKRDANMLASLIATPTKVQNELQCWGPETGRQQIDPRGKWYTFINELCFYELVFSSKLESAKKFRQWVFTNVLPAIGKYGM